MPIKSNEKESYIVDQSLLLIQIVLFSFCFDDKKHIFLYQMAVTMKVQMNFRIFSLLTIFSILISAVGMPTSAAQATSAAFAGDGVFTFASMGDAHTEPENFTTTLNGIATLNPDLVLFNGDLENNGVDTPEMDPMVSALKSANLFDKTFLVRGNHDDLVPGSAALWESYFEADPRTLPAGVADYTPMDADSTYLTYSFIYENSMFIGLDVPGDADLVTTEELDWLDTRLTNAESQGLTHAFIYFHGPMYPMEPTHSNCSERTDASCTPADLITVINRHPIVSAFLHGHEHSLTWTHMDNTRLAGLTGSFEQFITSPAGGWPYNEVFPDRIDYFYPDLDTSQGFATVSVNGNSFTYSIYKDGIMTPVWSNTFTKGITPTLVPTVTTQAAANITTTTATGNGNIVNLGIPNPTQHGVVWSTSLNPTLADNKTEDGPVAITGAFTSSITGLVPYTLYHVRAYATNEVGTSYGEDVTFTTTAATVVTFTTTGAGNWTAPAGVTSLTVEVWGGGGRGGSITSGSNEVAGGGGGGGGHSRSVITVTPGQNYAYFVGAGSGTTSPGGDSYFINASTVMAKGGNSVANNSSTAATGGSSTTGVGTTRYSGGNGASGSTGGNRAGGGGSWPERA